jgi:hypothetical protein
MTKIVILGRVQDLDVSEPAASWWMEAACTHANGLPVQNMTISKKRDASKLIASAAIATLHVQI